MVQDFNNQIKKSYYSNLAENKKSILTSSLVSFLLGSILGAVVINLLDKIIGKENTLIFTVTSLIFIVLIYSISLKLLILSEIENIKNETIKKKFN